jgi:RimJ/RimL family protein N-acetyltransferase
MSWPGLAARLTGEHVVLEPLEAAHEAGLFEAARESDWSYMLFDVGATPESFRMWMSDAVERSRSGAEVALVTLDARTGAPLGSSRYLNLRPEHRGLEIGWTWLARRAWGTGANIEAKLLMLTHAFDRVGCMRVEFKTDARNSRSCGALAALPAQFEGVFRKHMLIGDDRSTVRDSAWYSITDDEWPAVRANLEQRLVAKRAG